MNRGLDFKLKLFKKKFNFKFFFFSNKLIDSLAKEKVSVDKKVKHSKI